MKNYAQDVSAVVCSWNCAESIERCLKSLRDNNIGELILVDANSDDGTREIAKKYVDKLLTDPRKGLAMARNIGIAEATKKFVLNCGSDNIMPPNSINKMIYFKEKFGYSGVSAMTYLTADKKEYLSWAMNLYKKARFFPGERNVIGTPTLFETHLLKDNPYDNKLSDSDDGDLCQRLKALGHRFAIANVFCYEIGQENMKSVFSRWKRYGKSDWETYTKNSVNWSILRKFNSLTYPLRNELLIPFFRIPALTRFKMIPFLSLITYIRYYWWLGYYIKDMKLKQKGIRLL